MSEAAPLDLIVVNAHAQGELEADRADVRVRISGASVLTGNSAIKKAREVKSLVEALAKEGVEEKDIKVESVRAESKDGLLTKSSSVTYELRIRVAGLDNLADALGAITSQKNTAISGIVWHYDKQKEFEHELLKRALADAKARAEVIAEGLGVALGGVHRVNEQGGGQPVAAAFGGAPMGARMRAHDKLSEEMGLTITHAANVKVTAHVQFHIVTGAPESWVTP